MDIQQIKNLKIGDILKIENPKSPAAALQRERLIHIEDYGGCRIATSEYYTTLDPNPTNTNKCELNINLFGQMVIA